MQNLPARYSKKLLRVPLPVFYFVLLSKTIISPITSSVMRFIIASILRVNELFFIFKNLAAFFNPFTPESPHSSTSHTVLIQKRVQK